jgi:PAS domain S-box-containing protein
MQVHRRVRTIYAVRVAAFLWCFVVVALHAWERGLGAAVWIAAALHFLVYPHLAVLRSKHSRDQVGAEMQNLYADAFMLGVWFAVLEFPTWITCPFIFAPALNGIVNRGLLGFGVSLVSTFTGALAGVLLHGYMYWPSTSSVVTMLSFVGSLCYGAGVGYVLFRQTRRMSQARERLRTSELRYRLIAEHAGDLVAMVDRDGRWLYASPSYARIFRKDDLTAGGDAFRNLHEEDQFRVRGAVQVVVRSGEPCRLRLRLHTMNGEVRRFDAMVHPVKGSGEEGGAKIHGAVLASRDVTELRDREEQLEVAGHAFERMTEGMVITNAAGRILSVNRSYSRITGYAQDEVVGKQESEFRTAMQPESFYDDVYAEVLRTGHWDGTTWCRRRDGTLYREWRSVSAVRDDDGRITHYVSLFRELDSHGTERAPQDWSAKSA